MIDIVGCFEWFDCRVLVCCLLVLAWVLMIVCLGCGMGDRLVVC